MNSFREQLRAARDQLFPRDENQHSCGRKKRYVSKGEAEDTARLRLKSRRDRPPALRVYPCGSCGGWHLTKLQQERNS